VAHRPSILANVDKMLVLNASGVVEAFGPRQSVMQRYSRSAAKVVPLTPDGPHRPGASGRQEFTS
ncbi:MAG TPA: hypothetical protein VGH02_12050, partial [Rhizomicrobium sp.]